MMSIFRHLFFAVPTLLPTVIVAQTITITFEGNVNGTPVALDSILVENLTASGDTTIYAPDNTLVLSSDVGLGEFSDGAPLPRCVPNPFSGATEILVGLGGGEVGLVVHDATGKEVVAQRMHVSAGQHRFRYTSRMPGLHILSVQEAERSVGLRLLALEGNDNADELHYLGPMGSPKSSRSQFAWQPGDQLRYVGYGQNGGFVHSASITEVPDVSATRIFDLMAGLVCLDEPTVADIDGNLYPVVRIGSQCWMAENLRTTRYRNGDTIPHVVEGDDWEQMSTGAWCHYANSAETGPIYGMLYNYYAAISLNICPQGWHVPDDGEWNQLRNYLGYSGGGGKMKATGTVQNSSGLWQEPNTGATNSSGFSGLPGGFRSSDGTFWYIGEYGQWWSTDIFGVLPDMADHYRLSSSSANLTTTYHNMRSGLCVRCLRD